MSKISEKWDAIDPDDEQHVGLEIEYYREQHNITKVELARRMGMTRQSMWKITVQKSIDCGLLLRFCHALNHDFFQNFVLVKNEDIRKKMQTIIDQKEKENNELRKQLEDANKMIEEKTMVIDVLRGKR